ncbi:DUF2894 domain-containing protein [Xenophilus sp. Marseille-Q4582]|uniref:DUF2894 domain-containing protein n=1 Tax=Xenophilus sp. Marseille-Q4582 TaxID=2866600 RepID=UPI001CE3BA6B|nr:DUF2894 domain-containing protein [Xenophilus sp. Marseille-Q4582]
MNTPPAPAHGDEPLPADGAAPQHADALAQLLADWRRRHPVPAQAGGEGRLDTLFIHALARQAETRRGAVRDRLHARLAELIAAHDARAPAAGVPAAADARPVPRTARVETRASAAPARAARTPRTALAGLLAQLEQLARPGTLPASADRPSATDEALASLGGPPDLKAMGYFRSTWSRLSAERRLTQSLARVPDQAGPLNAQHLVHQTLAAMRALSPGYLNHFLDYADTLMWLERAQSARPDEAAPARSAGKGGKGGKAPAKKLIVKRSSRTR